MREARVVLGSVAPVPRRANEAEAVLVGAKASPEAAAEAVKPARPLGQNGYKIEIARVVLERALREVLA